MTTGLPIPKLKCSAEEVTWVNTDVVNRHSKFDHQRVVLACGPIVPEGVVGGTSFGSAGAERTEMAIRENVITGQVWLVK